jgi:hypothetical protein
MDDEAEHAPVRKVLKYLRERAGYTVRGLADAIGMPAATYASYERKTFKKSGLPIPMVGRLTAAFAGRGNPPITPGEVYTLAGLIPGTYAFVHGELAPTDTLAVVDKSAVGLTETEKTILRLVRRLDPEQQELLVRMLSGAALGAPPAGSDQPG